MQLTSLSDVVLHLQMKFLSEAHEYHIRRSEELQDLLRETWKKSYSLFKHVKTYFVGKLYWWVDERNVVSRLQKCPAVTA